MGRVRKAFKWWWGWQAAKIEGWLEEMEAQGWNLQRVWANGLGYQFIEGESRRVRYCFDYQEQPDDNYQAIFEDAGWKQAWSYNGWFLWAQEYQSERPEVFTQVESLIERNNRQVKMLAILGGMQIPLLISNFLLLEIHRYPLFLPFAVIWLGGMALIIYSLAGLLNHNRLLRLGK